MRGAIKRALMPLEVLDLAFVFFGGCACFEGAEIAAFSGLRVLLSGVNSVSCCYFSDHDCTSVGCLPQLPRPSSHDSFAGGHKC